jgi:hypothetical protein
MMEEQGGFGRFQLFAYLNCILGINATGYLQYNLAYLFLYPAFNCEEKDA